MGCRKARIAMSSLAPMQGGSLQPYLIERLPEDLLKLSHCRRCCGGMPFHAIPCFDGIRLQYRQSRSYFSDDTIFCSFLHTTDPPYSSLRRIAATCVCLSPSYNLDPSYDIIDSLIKRDKSPVYGYVCISCMGISWINSDSSDKRRQ